MALSTVDFYLFFVFPDRLQERRLPDRPPSTEPEYLLPSLPSEDQPVADEHMDKLKPYHQRNCAPSNDSTDDSLSLPNFSANPGATNPPPQDIHRVLEVHTLPNGNAKTVADHPDYRDVQFKALSAEARLPGALRGPVSDVSEGAEPHMMPAKFVE